MMSLLHIIINFNGYSPGFRPLQSGRTYSGANAAIATVCRNGTIVLLISSGVELRGGDRPHDSID